MTELKTDAEPWRKYAPTKEQYEAEQRHKEAVLRIRAVSEELRLTVAEFDSAIAAVRSGSYIRSEPRS